MVIGLTGGIGTGKSTVVNKLKEKGYPVVDTDIISREVINKTNVIESIKKNISEEIVENGTINRKKLGQIVFKDKKKLNMLNSIMHPEILSEMWKRIKELQKTNKIVIADIPLLFEINIEKEFDILILVYANRKTQIERIVKRDGRTEKEAAEIIDSQMDLELKRKKSDYVINNNSTLENLYSQIDEIFGELEKIVN